ncbi:thiol peroxidase [Vibrio splendidus]|uniref:thiol peroxidase n=1 Tax=Vibrio TaxID=662 RepID=UPI00067F52D0|nr:MULTISPECIES: thiol peroxidase [Vibrio]PTP96458.1 thiol peroxidase [Vibrio splendidus]RLQ18485.1 thiol peroxidase [Vibrio sp. SBT000027]
MKQVTLQGNPMNVVDTTPVVGHIAPDFCLTSSDFLDISLSNFFGKYLILNIFPSIDTPVCAASVKRFNEEVSKLDDTQVLCVSADLPFASERFCEVEGIEDVQHASTFRSAGFAEAYGVAISEGALKGLTARAVVCMNKEGIVTHCELVEEITEEPNYDAAIYSIGH